MTTPVLLWGHLQASLLLLAALALLLPAGRPAWITALAAATALALPWLPLGEPDLGGVVYGYLGMLSCAGLALTGAWTWNRLTARAALPGRVPARVLILIAGLLLYPAALGLGRVDPYAFGFGGALPVLATSAAAVLAWHLGARALAFGWAAALWCWALGWGESDNLWDYLIDAWLLLYALSAALAAGVARLAAMLRGRSEGERA